MIIRAIASGVFGPLTVRSFDGCADPEAVLATKTEFCNFIYTSRVDHRERFFRTLNTYKLVRAPGKSMNNCQDLESDRQAEDWHLAKLDYLRRFKFTIAFENSLRAGYASEKLFDCFVADTVPIYWGDPAVDTIVNTDSIIGVGGDWDGEVLPWLRLPEAREPFQPYRRKPGIANKVAGRLNDVTTWLRKAWPYSRGFAEAIEEIEYLDNDDEAYCHKLAAPRARRDVIDAIRADYFNFWRRIIADALGRRNAA